MPKFNLGWLKDRNGEKFAPKTFLSQILNNDGSLFKNRVESIENKLAEHDNKIVNNNAINDLEARVSENTSNIINNTNNIADLAERVTQNENNIINHNKRYTMSQFALTDEVTNCDYVVKIYNGEIIYFKKCVGIKITSMPTNLNVIEGGLLDTSDLVVVGICQDGSEREITDYKMSPAEANQITITYDELGETYSVSIDVNVIPIQDALVDFTYITNIDGTYTITGWKGTYNGESSTKAIIPNSSKVIV